MLRSAILPVAMLSLAMLGAVGASAAAQTTVSEVTVRARPTPHAETRTKVLKYGDLNIKSTEGAETLLGRIRQAADVVCSPEPNVRSEDYRDFQRCKTEAIRTAVAQVKSPELSAVYGRIH